MGRTTNLGQTLFLVKLLSSAETNPVIYCCASITYLTEMRCRNSMFPLPGGTQFKSTGALGAGGGGREGPREEEAKRAEKACGTLA